jgi:hypothetical protein
MGANATHSGSKVGTRAMGSRPGKGNATMAVRVHSVADRATGELAEIVLTTEDGSLFLVAADELALFRLPEAAAAQVRQRLDQGTLPPAGCTSRQAGCWPRSQPRSMSAPARSRACRFN